MKISHLQEGSEASMPTSGQIPMHSARDPKVLETSTGATGSGSVATVSSPIGSTISRNSSIYGKTPKGSMLKGIKTSKKYANSAHVNESHLPLSKIDPPDHGEPEGDFVKNQLHTIKRVVTQLERIIGNNEDLPEWVEMKVSQAQGMMVSIMQYMVSAKEREVERHTGIEGVAEGFSLSSISKFANIIPNFVDKLVSVGKQEATETWKMLQILNLKRQGKATPAQIKFMNEQWKDIAVIALGVGLASQAAVGGAAHAGVTGAVTHVAKDELEHSLIDNGLEYGAEVLAVKFGIDIVKKIGWALSTSSGRRYDKSQEVQQDAPIAGPASDANVERMYTKARGGFGGMTEDNLNELFEPTLNYYKLSNGKTVQVSYRPNVNQSPVPFTDVSVSYVNTALKPQGPSFDSTGVAKPWTSAPDGVKQAIEKFATQPQQGVAEGTGDDSEECWTCRGTGEGQHEGQVCSNCHGSGVEPVEHDDDDFDEPWDHGIFEDVIDEEVLAKKLAYQLQMFKRGKDKDLSGKPKAKDISNKPVYSNTLESKSKGSLPGAVSGIKIMSPEEFVSSKGDGEVDEATVLPAQQRELGGKEFQDYMGRIKGTDDIDKKTGQVKVDKKGLPKYTTGKTKTDKYKMPYVHRSSAIEYLTPDGKAFSEDAIKSAILQRPKSLLKQNEKMKHSNGELEQFFNVGFAALTGIAVDESTGKLIIVNTCPGAGSCKVDCFAMKGGKVQFKAAWLSDARILTYLLNDPTGFFQQLSSEISKEEALGKKGGYKVTVRWHDAGDFFSPEYMNLAFKMAAAHPTVKFYAYTKIAAAALGSKPNNFIVNWSEGANTSQEKQIKQQDPNLDTTKNSRIVPEKLFYDLLAKDEKGNLKKTADGAWQPASSEALQTMKDRLAKAYNLKPDSILSYDEMMATPQKNNIKKWNVIIAPGEGDISANRQDVLSTLLLRH